GVVGIRRAAATLAAERSTGEAAHAAAESATAAEGIIEPVAGRGTKEPAEHAAHESPTPAAAVPGSAVATPGAWPAAITRTALTGTGPRSVAPRAAAAQHVEHAAEEGADNPKRDQQEDDNPQPRHM